jgi:hypothetical protein
MLRENYEGGRVTVRVIKQRDLVVTFVAKIPRVIAKHRTIKVPNLMSTKIYKLKLKKHNIILKQGYIVCFKCYIVCFKCYIVCFKCPVVNHIT